MDSLGPYLVHILLVSHPLSLATEGWTLQLLPLLVHHTCTYYTTNRMYKFTHNKVLIQIANKGTNHQSGCKPPTGHTTPNSRCQFRIVKVGLKQHQALWF